MDCTVIKCKNCGTIMVVNTKELWKLTNCNKCDILCMLLFDILTI